MLLEDDKDRIRAEEIFRDEVRREIEAGRAKHSRGKRFWALLNSSFALWFLSSVVLGGLTAVVTQYEKKTTEQIRIAEIQKRLNAEISCRISEGLARLDLSQQAIKNGEALFTSVLYVEAIYYLDNRVTDNNGKLIDWSIYPEYQRRGFRSLVFELSTIVEPSALPSLREADADYEQLLALEEQTSGGEDYSKPPTPDKAILLAANRKASEILERLQTIPFWRTQVRFQAPARQHVLFPQRKGQ
jgi:hypothetical protein